MPKKYAVSLPADNYIMLPRSLMDKVKNCDANRLKLLLWLYEGNEYDAGNAAKALSMSPLEADTAAAYWMGAGVLTESECTKVAAAPSQSRPTYDASVIAAAIEQNDDFRQMCDQLSDIIGKVFNRTDYNTFFYLFDHCGLSSAFIITVAHFCANVRGKKDARYISNTALSIYDDGIDTLESLDKYIAEAQAIADNESRVRTLCGIGDRSLSTKEKAYITDWFSNWNFTFEMVRLAYERAVDLKGQAKMNYINGILSNWHAGGFSTPQDLAADSKAADGDSSFNADEFFTAALGNAMKGD